jgi:hypothetical protein
MVSLRIEGYRPGELPTDIKGAYIAALERRRLDLERESSAVVRVERKVVRWEKYLDLENCWVFVLLDEETPTAFATVLDFSKDGFVRVAELQSVMPQKGDGEIMLRAIQRRFPDLVRYLVVHKDNSARPFYSKLGGEEGKYWFPHCHPEQLKEDGWIGITFGELRSVKRYLCVILYGQEYPRGSVGIEVDVKTIEEFFKGWSDVKIVKIAATDVDLADLQNYLRKQSSQFRKIVIMYSGHALNGKTSLFPAFPCKSRDSSIRLKEDLHEFCSSTFEFSVVGADCCNSIPVHDLLFWPKAPPAHAEKEHPFTGTGHLLFSSSKKGQASYGSADNGGLFMRHFFFFLLGDWKVALERTKERLLSYPVFQEPQWEDHNFVQYMPKEASETLADSFSFVEEVQ